MKHFNKLALLITLFVGMLGIAQNAQAAAWHCTVTVWYNTNVSAYRASTAVAGNVVTACSKAQAGALSLENFALAYYGLGCGSLTTTGSVGDANYQYCFSLPTYIEFY